MLLAGEAGVGKTRLAAELAERHGRWCCGPRHAHGAAPYGAGRGRAPRPTCAREPDGLADYGPLLPHLALILPELGEPAPASDRATVSEAVRGAFAHLARERHVLSCSTTCSGRTTRRSTCSPRWPSRSHELPMLVVAAYRSDGLPRDHALRRLRHELRRAGRFDELTLAPLGLAETAELLAAMLEAAPAPSLARGDPRPRPRRALLRRGAGARHSDGSLRGTGSSSRRRDRAGDVRTLC